jgi:uncharacterized surface protein with fasciclin (FAS1) repeats
MLAISNVNENSSATKEAVMSSPLDMPQFSVLKAALIASGLIDALPSLGPVTIFAPTNEAFVAALGDLGLSQQQLLMNKALLTDVLKTHILSGVVPSSVIIQKGALIAHAINDTDAVPRAFNVFTSDGGVYLKWNSALLNKERSAQVIKADVPFGNSLIHVINAVIV